jgi:hypothetical protein
MFNPRYEITGYETTGHKTMALETKAGARRISKKACRGTGGTSVYARTRARAVTVRRRRFAAVMIG